MEPPFKAYKGQDPYIFVSYAHADKAVVYPEIMWLHKLGYRIWYDEGIEITARWMEIIAKAVDGCHYFLIYITPTSVESTYVNDELDFARAMEKPILAVHLENTQLPIGMRIILGPRQAIFKYEVSSDLYRQTIQDGIPARLLSKTLFDAISERNLKEVKALVAGGADIEAINGGKTPLMAAICACNLEIVRFLVVAGSNIEAKTKDGDTALICAVVSNDLKIVKFLIQAGADLEARNNAGYTALIMAACTNQLEIPLWIIGSEILMMLATSRNREIVSYLIRAGADLEARDEDGRTALMHAATNNKLEILRCLIVSGAEHFTRSNEGYTAYEYAELKCNIRIQECLGEEFGVYY